MIGHILRERWRLLAAIAVIGALAGAGASVLFSPGYQASSSVLLQGTRNDSELKTEAQIAASTVVLDRTATGLGWNIPGIELQEAVTAKVADGNVITITGAADTPEQARLLADKVAEEYLAYSAQLASNTSNASDQLQQEQREALRRRVAETNDSITELSRAATQDLTVESVQVRTQLEALRTSLADAMTRLDQADSASSRVKMVVMGPAQLPSAPAAPTLTHFVAGGALVFFLIGILGHLVSARADRRLRGEPEIGAALGAPVLGDVDAPDAAHAQDPSAPW